jgi:hypothetical protein
MWDNVQSEVRRVFRQRFYAAPSTAEKEQLQAAMRSRIEAAFAARKSAVVHPIIPSPWARRLALAGGLLLAPALACITPVEYEMPMGQRLHFELPDGDESQANLSAFLAALEGRAGIEEISVFVGREDTSDEPEEAHGGALRQGASPRIVTIHAWGERTDVQSIERTLNERFPGLNYQLDYVGEKVRTLWVDRLGHQFFDLDLGLHDVHAARARVLERLHTQGFQGQAHVEVESDSNGHRKVEIRLKSDSGTSMPGGPQRVWREKRIEIHKDCHENDSCP